MNSNGNPELEQILESAIVMSWPDLMRNAETGLIHVEYGFASTGVLDYLKVWSSLSPGHWLLACEYWTAASSFHSTGLRFDNGYESEGLAHILNSVMQHQNEFTLPTNHGRQGLLQIPTPTSEERVEASELIRQSLDRLGSALVEPALA